MTTEKKSRTFHACEQLFIAGIPKDVSASALHVAIDMPDIVTRVYIRDKKDSLLNTGVVYCLPGNQDKVMTALRFIEFKDAAGGTWLLKAAPFVREPVKLYVGNLPYDMPEPKLRAWFRTGGIEAGVIHFLTDPAGKFRGVAFVHVSKSLLSNALDLNRAQVGDDATGYRTVTVSVAKVSPKP